MGFGGNTEVLDEFVGHGRPSSVAIWTIPENPGHPRLWHLWGQWQGDREEQSSLHVRGSLIPGPVTGSQAVGYMCGVSVAPASLGSALAS